MKQLTSTLVNESSLYTQVRNDGHVMSAKYGMYLHVREVVAYIKNILHDNFYEPRKK